MPRRPRLHVDGAFYHVILRGNHRQNIFFTTADRTRFLDIVCEVIERFRMRVHAYCLMSNHVHLAIQVSDIPLGPAMMRVASRYARERQRNLNTTGHFFERRYRALMVDADEYLLALVRYIHLNPVRAHLVRDPADYPWSGHSAYLGGQSPPWLTTDFVLGMLGSDPVAAGFAYRRFVLDAINKDDQKDFMVGASSEPRAIGSDQFLAQLAGPVTHRPRISLETLIERLCAVHGVHPEQLTAPNRSRTLAKLRSIVLHHALHLRIASMSDIARHCNRSASTLCESLEHYRRTQPALFAQSLDLE